MTPDSFSDGGRHLDPHRAMMHGLSLLDQGADWLDIGGESTRPGAPAVSAQEEADRVLPVIEMLQVARPEVVISIDTSKAVVAAQALEAGARVVNDVCAASDPDMAGVVARHDARLILMHMRGTPRTMQAHTGYADLVDDVRRFLEGRVEAMCAAGIPRERLILDPGVGFGKALEDNPRLIEATPRLSALGLPVMVGASRKRFIGALTGVEDASKRVAGSVGAALAAAAWGADLLRVHDVAATHQALSVFAACGGLRR